MFGCELCSHVNEISNMKLHCPIKNQRVVPNGYCPKFSPKEKSEKDLLRERKETDQRLRQAPIHLTQVPMHLVQQPKNLEERLKSDLDLWKSKRKHA